MNRTQFTEDYEQALKTGWEGFAQINCCVMAAVLMLVRLSGISPGKTLETLNTRQPTGNNSQQEETFQLTLGWALRGNATFGSIYRRGYRETGNGLVMAKETDFSDIRAYYSNQIFQNKIVIHVVLLLWLLTCLWSNAPDCLDSSCFRLKGDTIVGSFFKDYKTLSRRRWHHMYWKPELKTRSAFPTFQIHEAY